MERSIGNGLEITGRLVGKTAGRLFVNYERHQANKFEINATGLENIVTVSGKSFIVAANHLEPEGFARQQLGGAPDSFVVENIVNELNPFPIKSVSNGDFMLWVFQNKTARRIQRKIERILTGFLEGTGDVITAKLNPGSVNVDFVRKVERAVSQNSPILIFPEGTWYKDWQSDHQLKDGTALIAKRFNLPIIPAYVGGANSWKRGTKVEVAFGKPIDTNDKTRREITENIRQGITQLQQSMQAKP